MCMESYRIFSGESVTGFFERNRKKGEKDE